MVQRPQRGVGEALVVVAHLVGGQPHRVQPDAVVGRTVDLDVRRRRASRPRRRCCARRKGSSALTRPPGLCFHRSRAVRQPLQVDRQPVGHDDEVRPAAAGKFGSAFGRAVLAHAGRASLSTPFVPDSSRLLRGVGDGKSRVTQGLSRVAAASGAAGRPSAGRPGGAPAARARSGRAGRGTPPAPRPRRGRAPPTRRPSAWTSR